MKITAPTIKGELQTITNAGLLAEGTVHNVLLQNLSINPPKTKSVSLNESRINKSEFKTGLYDHMQMMDVVFETCTLAGVKLPSFSGHRIVFRNCRLSGLQIYESACKDVLFEDCKLDLSNFRYCKLNKVSFLRCNLANSDFLGAEMTEVIIEGCDLSEADMSQCKITSLDLRGSELDGLKGLLSLKNAAINHVQLMGLAPRLAAEIGLIVKKD